MPSHQLPSTELKTLAMGAVDNPEAPSLLNFWKRELHYDFKLEWGKFLKKVTNKQKVSSADRVKADIFTKAATALASLEGREVKGRTASAVQVNVVTVDPTKH